MKNHPLFVLGLVALLGAPVAALADDKPPAADKKSEMKPGKHRDGPPGQDRIPGHPGTPDHAGMPGMRDGGAMPRMHDRERDGGAPGPGHHGYRNAIRELYQELKDGKLKKDELKAKLASLQDSRGERRKEHREDIGKRWGATLAKPPARDELKLHARRMAFLNRALVLSQSRHQARQGQDDRPHFETDRQGKRASRPGDGPHSVPARGRAGGGDDSSCPSERSLWR